VSVPVTRSLAYVLRERLAPPTTGVLIGKVVSSPNSRQVVVEVAGSNITVPKLASYATPVAGEPCYLLVAPEFTIALGTIK
jgi:hypothetical protein